MSTGHTSSQSQWDFVHRHDNVERRAWEHKSGEFDGFAREYHCDEAFENVLDAIAREKQLKGWRRSKKIALIEAHNPRGEDLAE
jgi:putative endonuclease